MPWKKGPADGTEYEHVEKHFRVKGRQWIYPVHLFGEDHHYVLGIKPHLRVRDSKRPDVYFSWPTIDGPCTRYFTSLGELKKVLDENGIRERPHYRQVYRDMRAILSRNL